MSDKRTYKVWIVVDETGNYSAFFGCLMSDVGGVDSVPQESANVPLPPREERAG